MSAGMYRKASLMIVEAITICMEYNKIPELSASVTGHGQSRHVKKQQHRKTAVTHLQRREADPT